MYPQPPAPNHTTLLHDLTHPTPRSQKQLTLFLTGATFLTLSTLLTRRAIHRKHVWPTPQFYTPSNAAPQGIQFNGTVMAVEALQPATLNVAGFGIMMAGGVAWGWDLGGWEDVRERFKKKERGKGGGENGDGGVGEEGMGEWVETMVGGRDGVVERAREKRVREKREELERAREKVRELEGRDDGEERGAVVEEGNADQGSKPWWRPW